MGVINDVVSLEFVNFVSFILDIDKKVVEIMCLGFFLIDNFGVLLVGLLIFWIDVKCDNG